MEPIGATASAITVIGTLITSVNTAHNLIGGLRDAGIELRSLRQEALELKAVLRDVKAASELDLQAASTLTSDQAVEPQQCALDDHLGRAQIAVTSFTDLVNDLILTPDAQEPAVKRIGWMMNRKRIYRVRKDLKRLKNDFALLLMAKTILGCGIGQIEAASTSRQNEVMLLLQRIMQGQTYTSYRVEHTPSPLAIRAADAAEHVEEFKTQRNDKGLQALSPVPSPILGPMHIQAPLVTNNSQIIPLNASAHQALIAKDEQCAVTPKTRCKCSCHKIRCCSTPIITSRTLGSLIIGVSGHITSDPVCDDPTCHDQSRYSMTVAYYFPSWLVAKAVIFKCVRSLYGNPSFGLHVRNLLPEHSPMMIAIMEGQLQTLRGIIEQRISSPDDMEEMGWTALTWAIHKNQVDICKFLLIAGADPALQDGFGNSAVDFAWLAVFEKQLALKTIKYLRESLVRNDDETWEEYNLSTVHRVVLGLHPVDLEEQLQKTPYAVINATDSFGKTPLLWASRRSDLEAVRSLLRNGANPNISDSMRRSPLHMAARSRSVPVIEALIKYGGDPNGLNFLNELPAHYACYEENSARLVKPFIDAKVNVNQPSKYGRTMLDIAVQWNHPVLVDYLLECGAALEGANHANWDQKPLGRAIMYKTHGVLGVLLTKSADTGFVDQNRDNILHFLARHGDKDVISHFCCCKHVCIDARYADAVNKDLKSPGDIASSRLDDELKEAFQTFLAVVRRTEIASESKKTL